MGTVEHEGLIEHRAKVGYLYRCSCGRVSIPFGNLATAQQALFTHTYRANKVETK